MNLNSGYQNRHHLHNDGWKHRLRADIEKENSNCASGGPRAMLHIFKKYIEIELQLGNFNRCRTLYEKYLEWAPANCYAWSKFAELERSLGETERARAIFELAIAQPALDMPELLWKLGLDHNLPDKT
ncbi:Crooked neck-like protein 1 [Nymphaea thermarum]|nr:Crooked neck-like protein 1 [Nymphaea thermarum]